MPHHLVGLRKAYFEPLMRGDKRIECRIGVTRKPPFDCVSPGDILWFKSPSGPIRALGRAGRCTFKKFASTSALTRYLKPYVRKIRAEPGFFDRLNPESKYASLIAIDCVVRMTPWVVRNRDQRGWVMLPTAPRPGERIKSKATRKRPGKRA